MTYSRDRPTRGVVRVGPASRRSHCTQRDPPIGERACLQPHIDATTIERLGRLWSTHDEHGGARQNPLTRQTLRWYGANDVPRHAGSKASAGICRRVMGRGRRGPRSDFARCLGTPCSVQRRGSPLLRRRQSNAGHTEDRCHANPSPRSFPF
jgi:hypothetical protein